MTTLMPLSTRYRSQSFLPVSPLPDLLALALRRHLLAVEVLRVHAHDGDLLVVRAVEDADLATPGQARLVAPEEIVVELLRRGLLEAVHRDAPVDSRRSSREGSFRPSRPHRAPAAPPARRAWPARRGAPGTRSGARALGEQLVPILLLHRSRERRSKSRSSFTDDPGVTRNGSMNRVICLRRSSAISCHLPLNSKCVAEPSADGANPAARPPNPTQLPGDRSSRGETLYFLRRGDPNSPSRRMAGKQSRGLGLRRTSPTRERTRRVRPAARRNHRGGLDE